MDFAFSESQRPLVRGGRQVSRGRNCPTPIRSSANEKASSGGRATGAARASACRACPCRRNLAGRGQDLLTTVAAIEGLGYGCARYRAGFRDGASLWTTTMAIMAFGSRGQKTAVPARSVRRQAARGQRGQRARSRIRHLFDADIAQSGTRGWILNGRKTWITSALNADLFVCLASTDPFERRAGDHGVPGRARHAGVLRRRGDPDPGIADGPDGRSGPRELRRPARRNSGTRRPGVNGLQRRPRVGARGDPGGYSGHDAPASSKRASPTRGAENSSASRSPGSSRFRIGSWT